MLTKTENTLLFMRLKQLTEEMTADRLKWEEYWKKVAESLNILTEKD